MRFILLAVLTAAAWPQAADHANSGYKTPEGRERVAKTLSAHDREQTQRPRELVAKLGLKPGMTVADIGTGVGFMLPYLAEAVGPQGKIIAEDIFPDFIERAKTNAKEKGFASVKFIQGTDKDAQLKQNSVDVALVLDVYHHFDYPGEMLASIRQGLKENGRLAVVDFYKESFRDPKHIRLDEKDVIKEVESNGFRLISSSPFQPNRQYMALFQKKGAVTGK